MSWATESSAPGPRWLGLAGTHQLRETDAERLHDELPRRPQPTPDGREPNGWRGPFSYTGRDACLRRRASATHAGIRIPKFYSLQRQLPAEGIGVFVYDKRGTGKSGGVYTQNYLLLADDAIAAMNEAKP